MKSRENTASNEALSLAGVGCYVKWIMEQADMISFGVSADALAWNLLHRQDTCLRVCLCFNRIMVRGMLYAKWIKYALIFLFLKPENDTFFFPAVINGDVIISTSSMRLCINVHVGGKTLEWQPQLGPWPPALPMLCNQQLIYGPWSPAEPLPLWPLMFSKQAQRKVTLLCCRLLQFLFILFLGTLLFNN